MVKTGLKGHHTSLRNTRKTKKMCERFPSHKIINSTLSKKVKKSDKKYLTKKVVCSIINRLLRNDSVKLDNRIVRRIETQSILRILASG